MSQMIETTSVMSLKTNLNKLRIVIVGDAMSGKSAYIHMLSTGDFMQTYAPTNSRMETLFIWDLPVSVAPQGRNISVTFRECSSDTDDAESRFKEYANCDAVFVMLDGTNTASVDGADKWVNEIKSVPALLPIVLLRNKVDLKTCKVKRDLDMLLDICDRNFNISVASRYNFEKPFFRLDY
jgi:GTPase SAR1 family protein